MAGRAETEIPQRLADNLKSAVPAVAGGHMHGTCAVP
jgi:hypothetical protein